MKADSPIAAGTTRISLAVALAVSAVVAVAVTTTATANPPESKLHLEAEAAQLSGSFLVARDAAASGGAYVYAHPSSNSAQRFDRAHGVIFCFAVETAGRFTLFADALARNERSNSFMVAFDYSEPVVWEFATLDVYSSHQVTDATGAPLEIHLDKGQHVVGFFLLEPRARLDAIDIVGEPGSPSPTTCSGQTPSSTTVEIDNTSTGNGESGSKDSTSTSKPEAHTPSAVDSTTTTTSASSSTTTRLTTTTQATTTTQVKPSTTTTEPTTTTTASPTTTAPGLIASGPISIVGQSNVTIDGYHFTGSGDKPCVYVRDSTNITITNSKFTNCFKGVYAASSSSLTITDNAFFADKSDRGRNAIQFDRVSGGYIARNRSSVKLGSTRSEDHINMFKSNGTSANPIVIENNVLIGGGPSTSGSGIVLGDKGGSHQIARNNTLINPGQVGAGITGGTHNKLLGNLIYSRQTAWSNVGVVVWEWTGVTPPCSDHEVRDNEVDWTNKNGDSNARFERGDCGPIVAWDDNNWNADLAYLE